MANKKTHPRLAKAVSKQYGRRAAARDAFTGMKGFHSGKSPSQSQKVINRVRSNKWDIDDLHMVKKAFQNRHSGQDTAQLGTTAGKRGGHAGFGR